MAVDGLVRLQTYLSCQHFQQPIKAPASQARPLRQLQKLEHRVKTFTCASGVLLGMLLAAECQQEGPNGMQPDACDPWPLSKLKDGHLILTSELPGVASGALCTSAVGRSVRLQETTRHLMTAGCLLAGV